MVGTAEAIGGNGGIGTGGNAAGAGGDANATATVKAGGQYGEADGSAMGGLSDVKAGKANATATVSNATSGFAKADSTAKSSAATVKTVATSPVDGIAGTASAIAGATIDGGPLAVIPTGAGQTVSLADFHPDQSTFASVAFSAGFGGVTQPAPLDYLAEALFTFSTTTAEDLKITFGLVNADEGSGGASLVFKYDVNGAWTELDFAALSDAEAYFSGPGGTLDLGVLTTGRQLIDFTFDLTANGDPPGFSMAFDAFATPATSPVPEPSTWAMMLAGFLGLGFAGFRSSRKSATEA